jgi:SHS2 domain-containing protein
MIDFEVLPHTADIKIRAYGATKKELFCNALIGMFQAVQPIAVGCYIENDRVICAELLESHDVEIKALDEESLLVDFLSEALYLSDVHNEAYLNAVIHELTDTQIKATLYGVQITGFAVVEIKAVTYHELAIKKNNNGWQVDIVFDI